MDRLHEQYPFLMPPHVVREHMKPEGALPGPSAIVIENLNYPILTDDYVGWVRMTKEQDYFWAKVIVRKTRKEHPMICNHRFQPLMDKVVQLVKKTNP